MNKQKGVSLIMAVFIMAIMVAIVLGITTILVSRLFLIQDVGFSVVSFFAADTGVEKTLYYGRKQTSFCNICTTFSGDPIGYVKCSASDPADQSVPIDCDVTSCTNCDIKLTSSVFDSRNFVMDTKVLGSNSQSFTLDSKGLYKTITRIIELRQQ